MVSDLDNKLNEIIGNNAEVVEMPAEPTEQAEVKNIEEGVNTAESSNKAQIEITEGETPSNDLEEELKNIDPELKEAILNASPELRESQIKVFKKMRASIDRKHTELGEAKKLAETTKDLFKQYGLDEKSGFNQVKNLIEFEKNLKKNPKEVIKNLQKAFKLEEESGSAEDQEITLDSFTDNERILYTKIKKAEEEAKLARQESDNLRKIAEREKEDIIFNTAIQVKEAVDKDGNLKNPYFDELLDEIDLVANKFTRNQFPSLSEKEYIQMLYDKALYLNDSVYNRYLEDKRKKENPFLSKKQEEALLKAKSINSQTLKHKPSSIGQVKSLDEKLLDIINAATN